MAVSALLLFYRGTGPDHAGRYIADIWAWDHRRLEMVHDFIQWLFPLPEPSRFNPSAPLLTATDVTAFQEIADLQLRAMRSLDLMLDFLGLIRASSSITRNEHFNTRAKEWLQPLNHNYLRLTRILLFLGHIGLTPERAALLACLEDIASHEGRDVISATTLSFWRDAGVGPR